MEDLTDKIGFVVADITKLDTDAIVNAANTTLLGGGGVDGAIHKAAGIRLLPACIKLHGCRTGEAKLTKGYSLKARYIIHTVGPRYRGRPDDERLLYSCYKNSLDLAKKNGIRSIAFPSVSTGAYGYPAEEAARTALKAMTDWLDSNKDYDIGITVCCFDEAMRAIYMQESKGE